MINEFSRTQLLIGEEGLSKLSSSTVMVFGVGGVGSHCIEALARCGIGRLILVDPDEVALTNINRQSIAYHSTVGQFKTKVMERILGRDTDGKMFRLLDFTHSPGDIADPWYTGDFDATYRDVMRGCGALLDYIKLRGK